MNLWNILKIKSIKIIIRLKYERLIIKNICIFIYDINIYWFNVVYASYMGNKGRSIMIRAIYFSLCFGLSLLGLFVITHINLTLGLSVFTLFIVKFLLMLPSYQE